MSRITVSVIGTCIDVMTWENARNRISMWARAGESKAVAICNAHSLVTAESDGDLAWALDSADMKAPDGFPVAFMMRRLGFRNQERISGPDLMLTCCRDAEELRLPVYLYGGTDDVLAKLVQNLRFQFPLLKLAGWYSPPFRQLTEDEEESVIRTINESGARILWVGLGCPKQEKWMHAHRGKINCVMVGVGAAFDFHAGAVSRAPRWMQQWGLEWCHRLAQEPRRLWKRYLVTNTLFITRAIKQLTSSQSPHGRKS